MFVTRSTALLFFSSFLLTAACLMGACWLGQFTRTSEIAFVSRDVRDIYSMDIQRGMSAPLLRGAHAATWLGWSRDGNLLAFSHTYSLNVLDVRTGDVRAYDVSLWGRDVQEPAWSPDARYLSYHAQVQTGAYHVFLLRVEDGAVFPLNDHAGTTVGAAWSPDGSRLAYQMIEDGCGSMIYVVDVEIADDGTPHAENERRVTGCGYQNMRPEWSPDGTRILYYAAPIPTATRGTEQPDVYVMDADGENVQRLSLRVSAYYASWSPDGREVLFSAAVGACRIYLMNADGTGLRCLSYDPLIDFQLTWRP